MRRLVSAQFLAEAADGAVSAALPLYVLAETDSPVLMATATSLQMIGGGIGGLIGGVLADRHDRQLVLRRTFLVRAALLVVALLAPQLGVVVVCAVLARACGQVDNPSFDSLMPSLATDGDIQQVMSLRRFVQSVSIILGPAIGALAAWVLGEQRAFGVAAAMFVGGALIHRLIHGLDTGVTQRRTEQGDHGWLQMVRSTAIVVTTPFVRRLTAYWVGSMITVALTMAAAVVWYEDTLGTPFWYGLALSAWGIGTAAGTLIFGGRRFTMPIGRILLLATPVYAACCAVSVAVEQPWVLALAWLAWGLAFGPEIVAGDPQFVAHLPAAQLGRAYAGLGVALMFGLAVGYGLAGPLLAQFGPRTTMLLTAGLVLAVGCIWLVPVRSPAVATAGGGVEFVAEDREAVAR